MSYEYERFVTAVDDATQMGPDRAERAMQATFQTLAERIAGDEVEELIGRLPGRLHDPLRRGQRSREKATRMSAEEFVTRVAEREGVDADEAAEHVRAVMHTLRDAVGDDEFLDVVSQLSHDYDIVLAAR